MSITARMGRNLNTAPPDYRLPGWQPGGFVWVQPWSQLRRYLAAARIYPGSANGLRNGIHGAAYLGPVPGPYATRVLATGSVAQPYTPQPYPGQQSTLPIAPIAAPGARPTITAS